MKGVRDQIRRFPVAAGRARGQGSGMAREPQIPTEQQSRGQSPLDDPKTAVHAWARYKRLMRFMFALTVGVVIVAVALIYREFGFESVHLLIASALGIGFTMLLMSALMGLVFLSSGTGHDEAVRDFEED